MSPLVEGFAHVAIVVDDLAAARGFYVDVLGLPELARPDFGVPGMWLQAGALQLHFIENPTMPVPGPGFPHFAFAVGRDDWDETIAALRAADVAFLSQPSERDDFGTTVRAAFVIDPAGNVVELTDVGPLPLV